MSKKEKQRELWKKLMASIGIVEEEENSDNPTVSKFFSLYCKIYGFFFR